MNPQSAENYRRRAMTQLKTHSLGTVSLGGVGGDALSVHALVRYTLSHGDPAQEEATLLRQQLREGALLALVDLLPGVTDIRNHASLELEVDHARHLALEPRTQAEARLCAWLARFAGERGDYREALRLSRELLPDRTRVFGVDHPETLIIRNNIAHWTGRTGEVREALQLLRELLPDQTRVLGADHPETENTQRWIRFLEGHEQG